MSDGRLSGDWLEAAFARPITDTDVNMIRKHIAALEAELAYFHEWQDQLVNARAEIAGLAEDNLELLRKYDETVLESSQRFAEIARLRAALAQIDKLILARDAEAFHFEVAGIVQHALAPPEATP